MRSPPPGGGGGCLRRPPAPRPRASARRRGMCARSRELAEGLASFAGELAHEYFHSWNLMRIRPAEYGDVSYRTPPRSRGLWFSEGLSMFYSDLIRRRAGMRAHTPTHDA